MENYKPNCYCKEEQKFCGTCEICGDPGHAQHHPDGVPYTGSWCNTCVEDLIKYGRDKESWLQETVIREINAIKESTLINLPLLIGTIKTSTGIRRLEERLKKEDKKHV